MHDAADVGRIRVGSGPVTDGLAPVRIDAVGGIEIPGPIGEICELHASPAKGGDVVVERDQMMLEEADNVLAGRFPIAAEIENRTDLGEGEPSRLRVPNEHQTVNRRF